MPSNLAFLPRVVLPRARRTASKSLRLRACATTKVLQSVANPRVKYVRSLLRRKQRAESGKVLLEGHRLVLDAVSAGYKLDELFYTPNASARSPSLEPAFEACQSAPTAVSDKVLASMSDTVSPQGVVAVMTRPNAPLPRTSNLLLVCDSVQDPGNVGTLIRAAAGAGAQGVLLSVGCADAWGGKALRSGMGAQLRVPVLCDVAWERVREIVDEFGMRLCVADGGAELRYDRVDWSARTALVIGSEAHGASDEALQRADCTFQVPLENDVESLNAAVAGAVILYEAKRQRDKTPRKPFFGDTMWQD